LVDLGLYTPQIEQTAKPATAASPRSSSSSSFESEHQVGVIDDDGRLVIRTRERVIVSRYG
jgi:hypothetical protein